MNQDTEIMIEQTVRPAIAAARRYSVVLALALSVLDGFGVLERLLAQDTVRPLPPDKAAMVSEREVAFYRTLFVPAGGSDQATLVALARHGESCPDAVRSVLGEEVVCSSHVDASAERLLVAVGGVPGLDSHEAGLLIAFDTGTGEGDEPREIARMVIPWLPDPADVTESPNDGLFAFDLKAGRTDDTLMLICHRKDHDPDHDGVMRDVVYFIHIAPDGAPSIAARGFMMVPGATETADAPDLVTARLPSLELLFP